MNFDAQGNGVDCNCVFLPYCDGGSFSGQLFPPVPVSGPGVPTDAQVLFRGLLNLNATINMLLDGYGLVCQRVRLFLWGVGVVCLVVFLFFWFVFLSFFLLTSTTQLVNCRTKLSA
jgi:hypothetical protein